MRLKGATTKYVAWLVSIAVLAMSILALSALRRRSLTFTVSAATNDLWGREAIPVVIANSSRSEFYVIGIREVMEGGVWQERDMDFSSGDFMFDRFLRLIHPKDPVRLLFPKPVDAATNLWRARLVCTRQLGPFERTVAERIKRLGFRYPFADPFDKEMEFQPP